MNNKSIQILRGTRANIAKHKDEELLEGQLIYNLTDNSLTIGGGLDGNLISKNPITVRELKGNVDQFKDDTTEYDYSISHDGTNLNVSNSVGNVVVKDKVELKDAYLDSVNANTISRPYADGNGQYQEMVNNQYISDKNSQYQKRINFDGSNDQCYIDTHLGANGSIYTAVTGDGSNLNINLNGKNTSIGVSLNGDNSYLRGVLNGYSIINFYSEGDSTNKSLNYCYLSSGYQDDDGIGSNNTPLIFFKKGGAANPNKYGLYFDTETHQLGYVSKADGKIGELQDLLGVKNGTGYSSIVSSKSNSTAENTYSIALGSESVSKSYASLAVGASTVEGDSPYAVALGRGSTVAGNSEGSVALGYGNTSSAVAAFSTNYNTKASGYGAFSEGGGTEANGIYSHAAGSQTKAGYDGQFVVGQFNDNKSNTLFEVGNGWSGTNQNAFEVLSDGRAKVYKAPEEDEDVVRLKEIAVDSDNDSSLFYDSVANCLAKSSWKFGENVAAFSSLPLKTVSLNALLIYKSGKFGWVFEDKLDVYSKIMDMYQGFIDSAVAGFKLESLIRLPTTKTQLDTLIYVNLSQAGFKSNTQCLIFRKTHLSYSITTEDSTSTYYSDQGYITLSLPDGYTWSNNQSPGRISGDVLIVPSSSQGYIKDTGYFRVYTSKGIYLAYGEDLTAYLSIKISYPGVYSSNIKIN